MNSDSQKHSFLPSRFPRMGLLLLVASVTASCASQYVSQLSQVSTNSTVFHIPTAVSVDTCRDTLREHDVDTGQELDSNNIRLVNWNIQKEIEKNWKIDYDSVATEKDLVLIQEASLRSETINDMDGTKHWSFAPGYRTPGEITGVLTLSSIRPLTQCSFVNLEPVFRTPKATNITQYALTNTEKTLVVVNVHAVNFSLGVGAFREQFAQISDTLSEHTGPVILSGDFNTWGARRMAIIEKMALGLELDPLQFDDDHRVRVMGRAIDHIYVRGLIVVETATHAVIASDHNPMSVTLRM
jgi:endonuclease/exonuclease/phosphatase (EEP) superfamily protein YafD